MSNDLKRYTFYDNAQRDGAAVLTSGALAIDGINAENVETAAAVNYCVDGVIKTLAAQAEIDISGKVVVDEDGATSAMTALTSGNARAYCLLVKHSDASIVVLQGEDAANTESTVPVPRIPTGYSCFGIVGVKNASGADFTFGTTALSTANVTDAYHNISMAPRSIAMPA